MVVEMEEVEKRLIIKHPSERAVKLANSIYFTSVQEGEPYVYISLKQLYKLFDDLNETKWYAKSEITKLLDELTEPVAMENFTYNRKEIKWEAVSLLTYEFTMEKDEEYVDIELNKMFLEVMSHLEAEPYINIH
jgi:hypothetical protein